MIKMTLDYTISVRGGDINSKNVSGQAVNQENSFYGNVGNVNIQQDTTKENSNEKSISNIIKIGRLGLIMNFSIIAYAVFGYPAHNLNLIIILAIVAGYFGMSYKIINGLFQYPFSKL